MTNKEINFRSIIFLIIGIILVLSLVICIYILHDERDLIRTSVEVNEVKINGNDKGENDVTVTYQVDSKKYNYNFFYDGDINKGDKIDIYYHENNVTDVQTYKTSYFILVGPIFGLLLCVIGLVETFKRKEKVDDDKLYETQVLNVIDDNTQQLSIITDKEIVEYEKLPEEIIESKVGKIKKEKKKIVKEEKKIDRIKPVSYYVSKDGLVCKLDNNKNVLINLEDIKGIRREINKNDDIIRIILVFEDYECYLKRIEDIDLNKISMFIDNKLMNIGKEYENEIIKR